MWGGGQGRMRVGGSYVKGQGYSSLLGDENATRLDCQGLHIVITTIEVGLKL